MAPFPVRVFAALVAAVATIGALASRAVAQAAENADPYKTVVIVTAPSPYWGYTYSPYGDAIRAHGDFLIKREQAAKLREEVRREKLKTKHMQLIEWEWQRDFLAGSENRERERIRKIQVERSRNLPPFTEIFAATSLNHLFDELQKRPELLTAGSTEIEADCLKHIDFDVADQGSIGLLKGEKIFWPPLLLHPDFRKEQEKLDELLDRAKRGVLLSPTYFQSNPSLTEDLRRRVDACQKRVKTWTKRDDPAWNFGHIRDANKFLTQVEKLIGILEKPDAAFYFTPLQGRTVAELVAYMKKRGIRFAPATSGCERHYIALRGALADEVNRLLDGQPAKNP